jgi:hypothetical protein
MGYIRVDTVSELFAEGKNIRTVKMVHERYCNHNFFQREDGTLCQITCRMHGGFDFVEIDKESRNVRPGSEGTLMETKALNILVFETSGPPGEQDRSCAG